VRDRVIVIFKEKGFCLFVAFDTIQKIFGYKSGLARLCENVQKGNSAIRGRTIGGGGG
jgi:hypothetical protein